MNNSEPTLTKLEETLTAYLDGKLSPAEAAVFEAAHPEVAAERRQHEQLRAALAKEAPALSHGDFFNHQLLREISPAPAPLAVKRTAFPLWRLAVGAAACLLAAAGIFFTFVGPQKSRNSDYFAQVLSVKAGDPDITAQLVEAGGVAVVWIDGLDALPTNYVLE